VSSKVIEQFNVLINWLNEIRLKGQLALKSTNFRFKEGERKLDQLPFEKILEPLAKVMK